MISHITKIRVRYGETDQMGYVYYGNYAQYYEVARTDMLRVKGLSYKELENSGIMMPVLEMKCKYIKPARYDEEISVKVVLEQKPTARIVFKYELYNGDDELINIGETTLVFVDMNTKRPCHAPQHFMDCIAPYFE